MIDNRVEITVVNRPDYVTFECPHCELDVEIKYSDFLDLMPDEYYGDWNQEKFECPRCGKEVEIEYVDWD